MKKRAETRFRLASLVILIALVLNMAFVVPTNGLAKAPFSADAAILDGLNVYLYDTYLYGWTDPDIAVTLTLKRGGATISQINTTSYADATGNPGYFYGYFSQAVLGSDIILVDLAGTPTIQVDIPPISIHIDKATNIVSGKVAPNSTVGTQVYSEALNDWFMMYPQADGNGDFAADFSSQVDIFLGDKVNLDFNSLNNVHYYIIGFTVPGLGISPLGDYVNGYAAPGETVHLTLKDSGGSVLATADATANSSTSYFYAYFYNPAEVDIVSGDRAEMQYGTEPIQSVQAVDVSINSINPATNLVTGKAPANGKVEINAYDDYQNSSGKKIVQANSAGEFSADFNSGVFSSANQPSIAHLAPQETFAREPQESPKDANRGAASLPLSNNETNSSSPRVTGGSQESQLVAAPEQPYRAGDPPVAPLDSSIPFLAQQAVGTAPALSPERMGIPGPGGAAPDPQKNTDKGMNPQATLGSFDIQPGSYATPVFHDAQDNQVTGQSLYAGPYVQLSSGSYFSSQQNYYYYYDPLKVIGQPEEEVDVTLRNPLGAIKGGASGVTDLSGRISLQFSDTAGNDVWLTPNDTVEVRYASGVTHTVKLDPITYVIDRDQGIISGTGPANSTLRVVFSSGEGSGDAFTDASGNYSFNAWWLCGGYRNEIYYRNAYGDDILYRGIIPQFTIYPDDDYVYGVGPANQAYVVTLENSSRAIKETHSGTIDSWSSYTTYFSQDIQVGDIVTVDIGSLHFEQAVVALSITADPTTDIVSGTAPANAWLNIFDENYYGMYSHSNYRYFHAEDDGSHATHFSQVRGGDRLRALYWENGDSDRVEIRRYVPYLAIDPAENVLWGYAGSGDSGTITIRDSSNAVKGSLTVNASVPDGYFYYSPGVDLVPGDQVTVNLPGLQKTSPVIPFSGSIDLGNDAIQGTSLPSITLGTDINHWRGSYFSTWTPNGPLSNSVDTTASGTFNKNFHAVADLQSGDWLELYYYDTTDTFYNSSFYTTSPTVAVTSHPTSAQPNTDVAVQVTLAGGAHSQDIYLRWDTQSHASNPNGYRYSSDWMAGAIGQNLISLHTPSGGTIYFRARAYVDGQWVYDANEYSIVVNPIHATTLIDPVSGTTNDATPRILGITAPGASVALYNGSTQVLTAVADDLGYVTFNITTPLAPGTYNLSAIATIGGATGTTSNVIHLTVDPTLKVDPVHILLTSRSITQHLRDSSGYANLGGQMWTRTGDPVSVSIPINDETLISAELYIGGVYTTSLVHSGNNYIGSYSSPTNGTYALSLHLTDSAGMQAITILNGLIDPDGYVYDVQKGMDYRLAGAQVTAYELVDEASNTWQEWNGAIWSQTNPQTVGSDGYYAFFTLPGKYKVKVSLPGYKNYDSPTLTVVDSPIHLNVPLTPNYPVYLPQIKR